MCIITEEQAQEISREIKKYVSFDDKITNKLEFEAQVRNMGRCIDTLCCYGKTDGAVKKEVEKLFNFFSEESRILFQLWLEKK